MSNASPQLGDGDRMYPVPHDAASHELDAPREVSLRMRKRALAWAGIIVLATFITCGLLFGLHRQRSVLPLKPLWKQHLVNGPCAISLIGGDKLVGHGLKLRTSIHSLEGQLEWSFNHAYPHEREVCSTVAGNAIAICTYSGTVYVFDKLGREIWNVTLKNNKPTSNIGSYYDAISASDEGYIFVSESTGTLTVLDANGQLIWSQHIENLKAYPPVLINPDGSLYAQTNDNEFVALTSTGKELWRTASHKQGWVVPCVLPDSSLLCVSGLFYPINSPGVIERYERGRLVHSAIADVDYWFEPIVDTNGQVYWMALGPDGYGELLATDYSGHSIWRSRICHLNTAGTLLRDGRLCIIELVATYNMSTLPEPLGTMEDYLAERIDPWHAEMVLLAKDGAVAARRRLDFGFAMCPPIELDDHRLLVVDEEGNLNCYDLVQAR